MNGASNQDSSGEAQDPTQDQSGSGQSSGDVRGDGGESSAQDDWLQSVNSRIGNLETSFSGFRDTVSTQIDGLNRQVSEGFTWLREQTTLAATTETTGAAQQQSQENGGEQESQSAESVLEVQDRTPPQRRAGARTQIDLGLIFRRLLS